MSSEEKIIATPVDENSIAIQEISGRLVDISQVAESLDAVIHHSEDEMNILSNVTSIQYPTTSIVASSSRKMMPGNSSDVSFPFVKHQPRRNKNNNFLIFFRIGIRV